MEQPRGRRLALIGVGAMLVLALAIRLWWAPPDGARAVNDEPRVSRIVAEDERLIAEVLNGTSRRGLARVVTRLLRQGGVDVVYFGTASPPATAETEILVRRGEDSAAGLRVARALGTGKVRVAPAPERRVDLTVIIGNDYHPPRTSHP